MKINKILILPICAVVVVAAAGSYVWFRSDHKKNQDMDFSDQTPDKIREYLRSPDFNSLDEQTRRAARRAAGRQMMEYRVNEYFSLPPDKQTAYLDKLIDEMETRRGEFQQRRPDANDPNSQQRRQRRQFARGAENQRARMESIDPLTRAKMAAFREAMRQQRQRRQ